MQMSAFQTLADPTRRSLVEALRGGELPVNDLVRRVEVHQSGVSRHLRILERAGFVHVRPDGAQRFYSLREEPFQALDAWLRSYRMVWEARLDRFEKALERRQASSRRARKPSGEKGVGPERRRR